MPRKIVVIGGVAAGPKAAARARRCDPAAEITVLEKGAHISYAGCGIPYYLAGIVKEHRELMETAGGALRDEAFFQSVKDIRVLTRTEARSLDPGRREVRALNLATGEEQVIPYDELVLATGSVPLRPPIPGMDLGQVFTLSSLEDAYRIRLALDSGGGERVVLVGGGLIGMELADALAMARQRWRRPREVTIVEIMRTPVPALLDEDMGELLASHLRDNGFNVLLGHQVLRFEGDDQGRLRQVVTTAGDIPADLAVVAVGVRPEVTLARQAGLQIGATGAIAVDERLRTSDPHIYAGGDCVENRHLLTGRPVYMPLGSTANRHGRVIGDNVTGGDSSFSGVLGTVIFKALDLNVGRTGLSERQAREAGFDPRAVVVAAADRAHYYPGSAPLMIKLVADAPTRKILGAQILGKGEVAKRVDVVAALLQAGATLRQLANLDLAYAPPFSTALDPLQHAANALENKLEGRMVGISPSELKDWLGTDREFVLLDVRTPEEVRRLRLADRRLVHVPLGKLRREKDRVPPGRAVVTLCKMGVRAYEALGILKAAGWGDVRILEGGLAAWPYETDGD